MRNLMRQSQQWPVSSAFPEDVRQVFNQFFNDEDRDGSSVVTSQWAPRVDIKEEAERFLILADLPGIDPQDVEVLMDKGILSIKGERKDETREEGGRQVLAHRASLRQFPPPIRAARQCRCGRRDRSRQQRRAGNQHPQACGKHPAPDPGGCWGKMMHPAPG